MFFGRSMILFFKNLGDLKVKAYNFIWMENSDAAYFNVTLKKLKLS